MSDAFAATRLTLARPAAALLVLALGAGPAIPGQETRAPRESSRETFRETTDVVLVEVPVQVLHQGEPLTGLGREDFELWDEKKKQPISGFEVVDLRRIESGGFGPDAAASPLPTSARRYFLLLFDLSFSNPTAIVRARDGARRLVREALHPADLVGVATYSEARGILQVLNFTSDRRQVMVAIDGLGLVDPIDQPPDPLRLALDLVEDRSLASASGGEGGGITPDFEDLMITNLKDQQGLASRTALEQKQGQITTMMGSFARLAGWLQNVPGQVHVVLLSEGFDSTVLLGLSQEDRERTEELAREVQGGQYWRVNNDERYGNQMALFGVTQALEEMRRAGAAIQAVDIGGLRSGDDAGLSASIRQEGLFLLANETGGGLYRNYNDLGAAMGELLERTSVTYVLAFQPAGLSFDGSYHRLRVGLKGGPKGAQVVHRPGYYAPVSYGAADPDQRRIRNAALLFGDQEGGAIEARALAFPLPAAGSDATLESARTQVALLLEVAGPSLIQGTTGNLLPVEVYAYALERDGEIRDFFAQALGFDLRRDAPALHRSGFKFWGDLALPPGSYAVRILIRNTQVGSFHAQTVQLEVPAALAGPLLLPPFFSEPAGRWMFARELGSDAGAATYPFVRRGETFLPAVLPLLLPDYENELTLLLHGPVPDELQLSARLRGEGETDSIPVALVIEEREPLAAQAVRLHGYLSPAPVAPGDYLLEVALEQGATKSSIPVRIESGAAR